MDCTEFRRQNTVPMFPGKVNRWIVAAADLPDGNETLVRGAVEGALLDKIPHDGLVVKKATQQGLLLLAPPIIKKREQLTVLPLLTGGPRPWSLSLEFNYRGDAETLSWPIAPAPLSPCDITRLDWCLIAVGAPLQDAPKEPSITDVLVETGDKIERVTSGPTKLLFGLAAVGLVGYLWVRKII